MMTVIAGILMLGILVFVHELGHFCVAKLCGVKVLKFSLGFGPRLVSHRWGETEYLICAIPLGGYVQMLGEGGGENGEQAELTPEERARSFARKPVSQRTAIVAAGPLSNLILPFVVLPLAYLLGVQLPAYLDQPPCAGYVVGESSAAAAGFAPGDCIQEINGQPVSSWEQLNKRLIPNIGLPLEFTVARAGEQLLLTIPAPAGDPEGPQAMGLLPQQPAAIGSVSPGMPGAKAGLQAGDRIIAIDGEPIDSWYALRPAIQRQGGGALRVVIARDAGEQEVEITPVRVDGNGDLLIGITPLQETVFKRFPLGEAIQAGWHRAWELIELTLVFLQKLFAGHISTKTIGGPIQVVQIAGQAAQTDLAAIFSVLAFLSIQLGILNLLPIPILDGGHLFFNLFEWIFRRPLSLRAREVLQQIGLALLILIMLLAFYNDLMRLFFGYQ